MKLRSGIFILIIALLFINVCAAAPYFRSTSLMNIPTAYISENGIFDVGFHTVILNRNRDEMAIKMDFGVFNFAELGLIGLKRDDRDYIMGNIKFLVARESGSIPSLSVGIDNFGEDIEDGSESYERSFYGVVSKKFNLPLVHLFKGHLGIGSDRYVSDTSVGQYLHGVFIGLSKDIHISALNSELRLMGELDGRDFNIGLKYIMDSGLSVNLAVGQLDTDPEDVRYHLGVSFTNSAMMDRIDQSTELAKRAVRIANEARSAPVEE